MQFRTAAVIAIALITAAPSADAQDLARIMKGDGREPIASYVRDDGLGVTVFALSDDEAARQRAAQQKAVFAYIAYTSIGKPSITGGIDAFDLTPLEFARYYYALAIANFGGQYTGKVTLKLSGPTKWTETFNAVTVGANTLTVLWIQGDALDRTGNYLFKGAMTGAGAMKSRFCAGC